MQSKSFQAAPNAIDFAKNDHTVLKFWESHDIFKKTEQVSRLKKHFVFYDGPPGTNGRPHIGHIMQSSLKDVWPRFKTMQGYTVLRKAGWDTHGLPVELTAEAELGLSGKVEIEKFGTHKFIEHCRSTVLRFRSDWVDAIRRLGRFLDCENDYLTMSNDFIQSDWWVMRQAFDKRLLYKDFKIVPYCARCGTGLSSHEVAQGYQDVTDLTLTAKFRLKGKTD
ncbi:MAG: isoleucine-tRNA ligase, partial [Pseudomonadota bacterium]